MFNMVYIMDKLRSEYAHKFYNMFKTVINHDKIQLLITQGKKIKNVQYLGHL